MNNLYALSLEKSTKTSEGIAKISDLLRSVLYECNEAEIHLDKEIKLIQNYIDLEKMRYGNRLNLEFEVKGNVNKKKIAPMLLFTFIENCFKHGSSSDPENPYIKIFLNVEDDDIAFYAENSKPSKEIDTAKTNDNGIGLINVQKRLDIIYNNRYKLKIQNLDDKFIVCLNISK